VAPGKPEGCAFAGKLGAKYGVM